MKGFNFEKNLDHQSRAVNSTVAVFEQLPIKKEMGTEQNFINPVFDKEIGFQYINNIIKIQG